MKKTSYLLYRMLLLVFFLFALGAICIVALLSKQEDTVSYATVALLSVALILLGLLFYRWIVRPYRKLQYIQNMFAKDQLYSELMSFSPTLTPEYELVIQHFYDLLGKQDTINLSKKQAEYLALQNQINPHFLYNTLEAIRGDAISEGAMAIAQTTEALSTFFRYTITETGNLVTVANELENIKNYFTIQQYRFGEKLQMEILTDDDPQLFSYQIPKLTLQPIIENAIYHGLENKVDGGVISIRMQTTEKRLLISIADNGVGMKQEDVNWINQCLEKISLSYIDGESGSRKGIALRNVSQRIKLLFGEQYGIQLYSMKGMGTEVRINLPKLTVLEEGVTL